MTFEAHSFKVATQILNNKKTNIRHRIRERVRLVKLTCQLVFQLIKKEKYDRRFETIEVRIALCKRQECRKRITLSIQITSKNDDKLKTKIAFENIFKNLNRSFSLKCNLLLCISCFNDEKKFINERKFKYIRTFKIINEAQKHLTTQNSNIFIHCSNSICKRNLTTMFNFVVFKSYVTRIHKINLRK